MFNIALCDDNPQFLKLLEGYIRNECDKLFSDNSKYSVGPSFLKAKDVLTYIHDNKIDVLFLDIDMPEMNGFDLAKILCKEYKDTIIVFVSAYDNFVYDSFEFSPFAYLRKNYISVEISDVVGRIFEKLLKPVKQLTFSTKEGEILFRINDILYFESKRNYFTVNCINGKSYECRGTLSQVEETVVQFGFYRIHSAFLVNMEHVDRIVNSTCVSIKGMPIPVAQRRVVDFRKAYTEYTRRSISL